MTTRATRSSARVATASASSPLPLAANSKFENDTKMKAICASANAYESFLNTYGKLVTSVKTREETILYLIENKCTKVYVPLILSKINYATNPVIEAITRVNQRLEGFKEDQIKEFFKINKYKKIDSAILYIKIALYSIREHPERKKEDYTEFICTAMHYSKQLEENIHMFIDYSTFLEIFNCWIKEYSVNGKIMDNSTKSYLSIVPNVLPEYKPYVLEKLTSMIVLSPNHQLNEPWGEKKYENIFNIKPYDSYKTADEYLETKGEIIIYIASIAHIIRYLMEHQNIKMLQNIAKNFPLNNESRFVEIINDILLTQEFKSFNVNLLTEQLLHDAKYVKQFLNTYYKLESITLQKDTLLNIIKKETALGVDVKQFIDKLHPLHRMAIIKRSITDLQNEWKLHTEEYRKMINTVDKFGLTPLAYAILFQNIEAVKFFTSTSPSFPKQMLTIGKKRIDYSVSISVLKDGFTIEDLIKVYGNEEIGKLFETKKDIQARWRTNIIKGYHQTSSEIAAIIEHTPGDEFWFLAGSEGMFGAGIYFAKTPRETQAKAHKKGIILEADVLLGNPLNITSHQERDAFVVKYSRLQVDLLYHALLLNGYDSVIAIKDERSDAELHNLGIGRFMQTGNEYMVYNTEQALFTKIVPSPNTGAQMGGTTQRQPISIPPWLVAVQTGDLAALKKLPKSAYHAHWLMASTPLMVACARGHMDIVKWLLEEAGAGAAINAKDAMNRNAIFYAMRGGSKEIVQYLITKGIQLLEKDVNGKYAVEYFNTQGLEKEIDLHKAAPKRVSVSVGYRDVLLKELVRMGDPAMDTVFRYYKNTMRPMTDEIKEKFISYFSHKAPAARAMTSVRAAEPWMGALPLRQPLSRPVSAAGAKKVKGSKLKRVLILDV